jgi:rSAM/selenodomain-associated transferase 2
VTPSFSIVVPVYNEADIVDGLLEHLSATGAGQIIIVDGGSTDGTWERLQSTRAQWVRILRAPAGRADQMNRGALQAGGDILLFLHADTRLPPGALETIRKGLERYPDRRWGRFDVRFDRAGPLLRIVAGAMNLRSAWSSICTGDQALFVYRRDFLALGGFAPVNLMEDVELSGRLKRRSPPLRVRAPVTTASRRWTGHGVARTIVLMWWLRWLYWWGMPTTVLSKRYYPDR